MGILQAAASWGCEPWVVTNEPPTEAVRQKWLARFQTWQAEIYRYQEEQNKQAEARMKVRRR